MKIFAERLKELREEKGWKMQELAEKIGVSTMAISRWEREIHIPNIENLNDLANVFKVSADYLLGREN